LVIACHDSNSPTDNREISERPIDQTYLVALKLPSRAVQHVIAASLEIQREHLFFFNAEGELAALFLLEIVQSWNVPPPGSG
jgi:hypothetical protein